MRVIVDWKTGKSSYDNRLQFGCYTIYASAAFGIAPERIKGLEVNLATGLEKEYHFTRADLDEVEEQGHPAQHRPHARAAARPGVEPGVRGGLPHPPDALALSGLQLLPHLPRGDGD